MTKLFMRSFAVSGLAMAVPFSASAQDATLEVGGRLMLDYAFTDIKNVNGTNMDFDATSSEVRRARLFAKGKYGDSVSYKFEFNHTTGSDLEITDGYVQFAPKGQNFKVKVGHFKTHNSLEEEASSRFITTIERGGFTDAFALDRRLGLSIGTSGENYTLNVGVYGESINSDSAKQNGKAAAARATFTPVKTDDTILHLGASWRYRKANDSEGFRYRQRPYAHSLSSDNTDDFLPSGRIVNAGRIVDGRDERFGDSDNFFAIEGLAIHNNLWAAAEYSIIDVKGRDLNPDANFSGGYIEGGIMFGGRRAYKSSGGTYDRMKVDKPFGKGGMGAVALVARYDTLDLQDNGYLGKLDTIVLGVDWLPTKQTRLRLNYFNADAENGYASSASGINARLGFDF
jgi:phosphate-selective porin OprO/OprP